MKISLDTHINNIYTNKQAKSNISVPQKNIQANNEITNNTIPELLGRYQVLSFKGTNSKNGPVFEHSCQEILGEKEQISYNKEDGSFVHTIFFRNGKIKRQEEFHPLERTETITTATEEGSKTVITKEPYHTTKIKYDNQGRQIYFNQQDADGNKKIVLTEYDKNRKIITTEYMGSRSIEIIDLKTNKRVTKGPLIYSTEYDEQSNSYITRNILNNKVHKIEKYRMNGELKSSVTYYPDTDNIAQEVRYNPKSRGYDEYSYLNDTHNTLSSIKKISQDGCEEHIIEYYTNGLVKQNVKYLYSAEGNLETKVIYENSDSRNNSPRYVERYENGRLSELIEYNKISQNIEKVTTYNEDGSYDEAEYFNDGKLKLIKFFDANSNLYSIEEYSSRTENIKRKTDYDRNKELFYQTYYDEDTEVVKKFIILNKNRQEVEHVEYYEDGKTKKYQRTYNKDRSYSETTYYENGRVKRTQEYNADGTRKVYSSDNTSSTKTNTYQEKPLSDEEFLHKITDVLAHGQFSTISFMQWHRLADILGLDDASKLSNMDKDTYKFLAKKFHPDRNTQNSNAELIMCIINALYQQRKASV